MSAFKTYVIKEIYNGAVFERRVEMALAEELDAERAGTPPDLSKAVKDEDLVKMIEGSRPFHMVLTSMAAVGGGVLTPEQVEELKNSPLTDAGKRLYNPPQPGTLEKPALLETPKVPVPQEVIFVTKKPNLFEKLKGLFQ